MYGQQQWFRCSATHAKNLQKVSIVVDVDVSSDGDVDVVIVVIVSIDSKEKYLQP
jgi:hypothetical protein